jgi:hypothetical protein
MLRVLDSTRCEAWLVMMLLLEAFMGRIIPVFVGRPG